jgi:hypothetical protein
VANVCKLCRLPNQELLRAAFASDATDRELARQFHDGDLAHLIGNGVIAIASPAVHTGSQHEVRAKLMRQTEKFIYVAFPIADMNAPAGSAVVQHENRALRHTRTVTCRLKLTVRMSASLIRLLDKKRYAALASA